MSQLVPFRKQKISCGVQSLPVKTMIARTIGMFENIIFERHKKSLIRERWPKKKKRNLPLCEGLQMKAEARGRQKRLPERLLLSRNTESGSARASLM